MFEKIEEVLKKSNKLVFFTGAGISTESGIPDFRSAKGLYSEGGFLSYPPETILSKSFFDTMPEIFYRYYFEKIIHKNALPNEGHKAIVSFEKKGYAVSVITQNIDGLHEKAGSKNVIELHGSVYKNKCISCGAKWDIGYICKFEPNVPVCSRCGGIIRPEVTLYEEPLDLKTYEMAAKAVKGADILFAVGSSLTVYPASGLLDYFKGDLFVIINHTETLYDTKANHVIRKSCGLSLKRLAESVQNE